MLGPPSFKKKLFVKGTRGALKIGQVLNSVRLDFRAEVLKLGGVKDLHRGRERSSDLMIERMFSNLFFVKYQNLFPQNSCILPIKSIETSQLNCYRLFSACFLKRGEQCRIEESPKFGPPDWGRGGICGGPTILLY